MPRKIDFSHKNNNYVVLAEVRINWVKLKRKAKAKKVILLVIKFHQVLLDLREKYSKSWAQRIKVTVNKLNHKKIKKITSSKTIIHKYTTNKRKNYLTSNPIFLNKSTSKSMPTPIQRSFWNSSNRVSQAQCWIIISMDRWLVLRIT